jgi:hypothetical protein
MRPRSAPIVGLLLAAAFVAGCGSGASSSVSPAPSASPSDPPSTAPPTSPLASPEPGRQTCAPHADITITILMGRIDCASSYLLAARVDRSGEKRQHIDGYVCEFGNAMSRPTIFTCTDREARAEFAVDER